MGTSLVGRAHLAGEGVGERKKARQHDEARHPLGVPEPGLERHGAALREASQDDLARCEAAFRLALDERLDLPLGCPQALLVLAPHPTEAGDVVPGAHHRAAVDGDGPQGRMREDEPHGEAVGQIQLGNDGLEIMAVGAEAVHPDHGGPGRGPGLDLDGVDSSRGHGSRRSIATRRGACSGRSRRGRTRRGGRGRRRRRGRG